MSDDTTGQLRLLVERLRQGDPTAREELLERAYQRLRRLARALLHRSFPDLRGRHDADSIAHDAWVRLRQALETTEPPSLADFFGLAAHKVRQVLLDVVERQRLRDDRERLDDDRDPDPGAPDTTHEPAALAVWTEFHRRVERLPDLERRVFELHHYLGLSQAEVARLLDLHPRKVSYLWVAATDRLADGLQPWGENF
jgi:RNA polymerase sigma factor (sigma-70 family)